MAALGLTLALLTLGVGSGQAQSSPVQLTDVTVTTQPDAVTVHIKTSGPAKYQADLIDTPDRLVLDLADTTYAWRKTPLDVGSEPLKQIRGSQYRKGIARVVVQLTRRVGYAIREDADGLAVVLPASAAPAAKPAVVKSTVVTSASDASQPATARTATSTKPDAAPQKPAAQKAPPAPPAPRVAAAAPAAPAAPRQPPAPAPRPQPTVRILEPPQAPLLVAQAATPQAPAAQPAGSNGQHLISFDFKDADVVNLLRILAAESGKNIVIGDDVKGKMSISLHNVPWELALDTVLEARGLQKVEKDGVMRIVSTEQLSKEREAKARLEEAKLKAEADVRSKIAEAQIKEQEAEQRRRAAEAAAVEAQARGPLTEETIRLAYADPDDIATTLQGVLGIGGAGGPSGPPPPAPPFSALYPSGPAGAPPPPPPSPTGDLLAKGITIRAHKPTNSIFIRHYQADLERIKKLIREKLDIPLPQVKIEARLSELNRRDFFSIGVQWGGAGVRTDGRNILVGQGVSGQIDALTGKIAAPAVGGVTPRVNVPGATSTLGTVNAGLGATPFSAFLPVSGTTGLPLGGNVVSFPAASLLGGTPAGVAFGIIGRSINLNLVLQALEEQSKARSLSKPEVVTVENSKATISLGVEIPYATVSSAGTQIQFKDAVLKLEVTPTVIFEPNATKVKMKVIVTNDKESGRVSSGVPILSKQHAETEVIVKEGDTLVIGGITQRGETETVEKVPLLGDIPILGWLFKQKSFKTDPNNELVVFITPSLVKTDSVTPSRPASPAPK